MKIKDYKRNGMVSHSPQPWMFLCYLENIDNWGEILAQVYWCLIFSWCLVTEGSVMFVLTLAEEAFYFIVSHLTRGCSHPSLVTGRGVRPILTLLCAVFDFWSPIISNNMVTQSVTVSQCHTLPLPAYNTNHLLYKTCIIAI